MIRERIKVLLAASALTIAAGAPAQAQSLEPSQQPLFMTALVEPNVLFVLDDSGSMHWETMPDEMTELAIGELECTGVGNPGGNQTRCYAMWMYPFTPRIHGDGDYAARRVPRFEGNIAARLRSSHNNTVYYNPAVTYLRWINADGTEMPPASASAALHNPVNPGLGTRNLSSDDTQTARWINDDGSDICHEICNTNGCMNDPGNPNFCEGESLEFYPAVYYHYSGSGDLADESSYERVEIRAGQSYSGHGRENRTDCNGGTCTGEQELQNFANWYTYHRNRVFAARAGIGRAFSEQSDSLRVGYGTINTPAHSVDGRATQTVIHGVRRFGGNTRERFFTELYTRDLLDQWNRPQGTPLREALQGAGEYFSRSDDQGPWSDTPGDTGDAEDHLECRQSYTVLMTDGYWNQSGTIPGTGNPGTPIIPFDPVGNVDGTYGSPFGDSFSDTLADVAMHYWENDLRTDLDDRVPTSRLNPANWQHMVTFGVGLGVQGSIDPDEAFEAILTGDEIPWPEPGSSTPPPQGPGKTFENIDDLLHAGVNSRGGFFSAMDAEQFSRELSNVLRQILARAGAVTGFSTSSTRIVEGSKIFEAGFDSNNWTGDLIARDPTEDDLPQLWSAANRLNSRDPGTRNIFTWDSGGQRFDQALSTEVKTRLTENMPGGPNQNLANALINYIRGQQTSNPVTGEAFRERESLLGDIVSSEPTFAGPGNEGWMRLDAPQGPAYAIYIDEIKQDPRICDDGPPGCPGQRPNAVFVGANDGMLHAFDAETGEELFAYVPSAVHGHLHELADPNYGHRFYVDGQITIGDAYIGGGWKTILVGSLGAGGQGIFALDITRPQSFSANNVLWDMTPDTEHFENLGYTFGSPQITRLRDGTWVAVFGNGYGGVNNKAQLYVVNLETGGLVDDIVFNPNQIHAAAQGLSGPRVWLHGGSRLHADRIYAGDLQGNLWRASVENDGSLSSRYGNDPLIETGRPITVNPTLVAHPGGGLMVYFGTGKFIEDSDRTTPNPAVETFWAVRDTNTRVNNPDNTNVISQATMTTQPDGRRSVTNEEAGTRGWRLNLVIGTNNNGERVLATPRVIFGRVIFTSYQPRQEICDFGGIQRIYVLNAINGNGRLSLGDSDCSNCGGVEIGVGAPIAPPVVIMPPTSGEGGDDGSNIGIWDPEFGYIDGTEFRPLGVIREGRQVWRQVK